VSSSDSDCHSYCHHLDARPLESRDKRSKTAPGNPVIDATLRMIETNGINMRIAEAGEGPVVLLVHGWPESWYSWRHQLRALADAGFRAIAPDMRGYGATDAPDEEEAYRVDVVTDDLTGILDAVGEQTATLVAHDMGAVVGWTAALLRPERFNGVMGFSNPYRPIGKKPLFEDIAPRVGDMFFYMAYHNEPGGIAEAEYDSRPRELLERLYASPDTPRAEPTITDPKRNAGGWIGRMGAPLERPAWLTEEDLDYYVAEFTRAGFRGGLNYYRNLDRYWHVMRTLDPIIKIPSAFVCGTEDTNGADQARLEEIMTPLMSDLRFVKLFPGIGHWVQQEAPEQTNRAIIEFLSMLPGS
jgi:pimeloyl-ACP methyl ester carboxylesterase